MVGKKFTSLTDGRIVEVKDAFEDIIILNDNSKLKASRLMDKAYYEEYIDPSSFFQNQSLLNSFAQKIKQIPDDVLSKMTDDDKSLINESIQSSGLNPAFEDSAVLPADPELEKEELMRKYGIKNQSVQTLSPQLEAQKQMEKFQALLKDPEVEESTTVITSEIQPIQSVKLPNDIIKVEEISLNTDDPIITMFKNVKRNREFKISIEIENKIPRPDFIEMMEDSYNTSIIDFLADEFTNDILNNPQFIREKIKNEIEKIVYGDKKSETVTVTESHQETPKRKSTTRPKKKEITND